MTNEVKSDASVDELYDILELEAVKNPIIDYTPHADTIIQNGKDLNEGFRSRGAPQDVITKIEDLYDGRDDDPHFSIEYGKHASGVKLQAKSELDPANYDGEKPPNTIDRVITQYSGILQVEVTEKGLDCDDIDEILDQ